MSKSKIMRAASLIRKEFELIKSEEKTHPDHIADRGQISMSHYSMLHKPMFTLRAVEVPAANVATDRDWSKWRTKHLYLEGQLTQQDLLLIEHHCNSKLHRSCISNTLHPPHNSESVFGPHNVERE